MKGSVGPLFASGAAFLTLGCLILAAVTSSVVPSFEFAKNFQTASCTVESSHFAGNICCTDYDCLVGHPCLQIVVSYTREEGLSTEGLLYKDSNTVLYQESYVEDGNCSFYECESGEHYDDRYQRAREFQADHGVSGQQYQCYYDPSDSKTTLLKRVSASTVIHGVLWPSLLLVGGIVLLVLARIRAARDITVIPHEKLPHSASTATLTQEECAEKEHVSGVDAKYACASNAPTPEVRPDTASGLSPPGTGDTLPVISRDVLYSPRSLTGVEDTKETGRRKTLTGFGNRDSQQRVVNVLHIEAPTDDSDF